MYVYYDTMSAHTQGGVAVMALMCSSVSVVNVRDAEAGTFCQYETPHASHSHAIAHIGCSGWAD